jgi:hypothetical protein
VESRGLGADNLDKDNELKLDSVGHGKKMNGCKIACLLGVVATVVTLVVIIATGGQGNADMEEVDKVAIKESKAKTLRIRQGGTITCTAVELNGEATLLDWHMVLLVGGAVLLVRGGLMG